MIITSALTTTLQIILIIIIILIMLVSLFAIVTSIYLAIRYLKYNRYNNSCGLTGTEIARKILDDNQLEKIKVNQNGSLLFGNSYSHYFKKVRLRRLIYKKRSLTSLAIASQKASLAILDKENDPDMKKRIRILPIVVFGPFAFIPLVVIGLLLDIFIFHSSGVATIILTTFALVLYLLAFVLNFIELKTEKKAQERAIKIVCDEKLVTEEEIKMMRDLYHLYNIEYVNNMIISFLEFLYYIIRILLISSLKKDN